MVIIKWYYACCMESTGVYWKPVYNLLEDSVLVVWICKLLLAGLLKPSYILGKGQRELRDLTRYRTKLIQHIALGENRTIRTATLNYRAFLSNNNGVVSTYLIDMLCDGKRITLDDVLCVYHRKIQASPENIYKACKGLMSFINIYILHIIRNDIAQTTRLIEDLMAEIGLGMSAFHAEKHLASWAGMCLGNNESAGKVSHYRDGLGSNSY